MMRYVEVRGDGHCEYALWPIGQPCVLSLDAGTRDSFRIVRGGQVHEHRHVSLLYVFSDVAVRLRETKPRMAVIAG